MYCHGRPIWHARVGLLIFPARRGVQHCAWLDLPRLTLSLSLSLAMMIFFFFNCSRCFLFC